MTDGANAAGAGRQGRHLIKGPALTELLESTVLGYMETGIAYHAIVVEVDGDLRMPLNTGDGVDEDLGQPRAYEPEAVPDY